MRIILLGVHRMSTTKVHINNKSQTKGIRFEHDLIELVDKVRGDVSFSAWVKRAVMNRLKTEDSELFVQLLHDRKNDIIAVSENDVVETVQTVDAPDLTDEDYKTMNAAEVVEYLRDRQGRTWGAIAKIMQDKGFTATRKKLDFTGYWVNEAYEGREY